MKSTSGGVVPLREILLIGIPALALLAGAFWLAFQFVEPAPPKSIAITTGLDTGAYFAFGKEYAKKIEKEIKLEVRSSNGSVENVARLMDPKSGVQLGLVQGGIADATTAADIISLGRVFLEPLWIFYRGPDKLDRIAALTGKRIAVGPEGSGTRRLADKLLAENGISIGTAQLIGIGGQDAANALVKGEVDAVMLSLAAGNPIVQALLRNPEVHLMSIAQAEAYTRILPYVSHVVLPKGVVDLAGNIPNEDVSLLATQAALVAHRDLHPAVIALMVRAATEVHGGPGLFQRPFEFPKPTDPEFPMSDDALRSYKAGQPPILQRILPFWVALLVQRLAVMMVPVAGVLLPLIKILPQVYQWRIRRRILRWYGELKKFEARLAADRGMTNIDQHKADIEAIEEAVSSIPVPLRYSNELYELKSAVALVRQRVTGRA